MRQKGVFPYEYMDSWEKLPGKEGFHSTLNNAEGFQRALKVRDTFQTTTMEQYLELYLETDVRLLADTFESFRATCLEMYSLDPAHYHTIPGLAYDSMLRVTQVELQLFTDINMYLFMEEAKRGGLSQASLR